MREWMNFDIIEMKMVSSDRLLSSCQVFQVQVIQP